MNLAILYRQATDPGIAARNKLTGEFMSNAWLRCRELIAEAKHRYPIATERQFWEKYVAWGGPRRTFDKDECRELLRKDPDTLVPALYLFLTDDSREAEREAIELLQECHGQETEPCRYITSVIQATLGHLRRSFLRFQKGTPSTPSPLTTTRYSRSSRAPSLFVRSKPKRRRLLSV